LKDKVLEEDTLTWLQKTLKTVPKNAKPIFGYRFLVTGDFNGDGIADTLTEHFISLLDGKEANKFYDSLSDYGQLVALTIAKEPESFVSANSKKIDTLFIWGGGQLSGLSFLKNEGDLDGDGADDLSYVVDWADESNLNTCHLVSYKRHKWVELYSFPIWDWQIPELPSRYLSGAGRSTDDSLRQQLEINLKAWPGFIKKIENNKIRVIFRNDDAMEDSTIIDLKHIKKDK
jgi:hypothetical protein